MKPARVYESIVGRLGPLDGKVLPVHGKADSIDATMADGSCWTYRRTEDHETDADGFRRAVFACEGRVRHFPTG